MQNLSAKRQSTFCGLIMVIFCCGADVLDGQTIQDNAWTNAVSGNWEDPYWSLGTLPGTNQAILLTNAGWKAVAIGPSTVQNYPQTLDVDSITLSSPPDSCNVLLLNYAGYQTPVIANVITLNSNTAMTILASTLDVTNAASSDYRLEVGGTVNEGAFSSVRASFLSLGNIGPGVFNLTNGTLNVDTGYVGGTYTGQLNQFGGYNFSSVLRILGLGEYNLSDGSFGGALELYYGGIFQQSGGTFNGSVLFDGTYELEGGVCTSTNMSIPDAGTDTGEMLQTGGTNQISQLSVGGQINVDEEGFEQPASGGYVLSNGVLVAAGVGVGDGGTFWQTGGIFTNYGELNLYGQTLIPEIQEAVFYAGAYTLEGGYVASGSIVLSGASFAQTGGTNEVAGTTIIQDGENTVVGGYINGTYSLRGGLFTTPALIISVGKVSQSGGALYASNLCILEGLPTSGYDLSGGQLVVSNLQLRGFAPFHHRGGTLLQQGLLTLAGGLWDEQTSGQRFGPLQLEVTNVALPSSSTASNSLISLPTNGCILRFADSSSLSWRSSASLVISNWSGSTNGGGAQQIIFGDNNLSLTPQQLSEIFFANPPGFPSGSYPARILSTGEVVPIVPPAVAGPVLRQPVMSSDTFSFVFQTSSNSEYSVQSTTNVSGGIWDYCTNLTGDGSLETVVVALTNQPPAEFFRVISP
jgi:hypothetical protein